jgi:hypothetical protein
MLRIACLLFLALHLQPLHAQLDESVALEGAAGLARATQYLLDAQGEDGLWSKHPGVTGAAVLALVQVADLEDETAAQAVRRGLAAIAATAREDGSFQHPGSKDDVYSTSMCLYALSVAMIDTPELKPADVELRPIVERASQWLARAQQPAGPGYGGAGFRYADNRYPDLSNTQWAAEALFFSALALDQTDPPPANRKMLDGAVAFISACQIREGDDAGAFGYFPPGADAPSTPHDEGVGDARLWGSLTYGALKTLSYGGTLAADQRVQSGIAWAAKHDTVAANPGLEDGGYFYYLYMYATTRNLYRDQFPATWQRPLVEALLSRQKGDGNWQNTNPLWLERDSVLCTAYACLAIRFALQP